MMELEEGAVEEKLEGFSNNTFQVNSYFFSQIDSPHHKRPSFPKDIPNEVCELIEECWDKDPTKRPSADEIVKRIDTFSI